MHMLSWLSPKGTAAIVEFPGVLYRGGAEQKIRKYMIDNNFIDTVIQLPPDLFFGTTIATCILVLKKNKTDNDILFVDASTEFVRNTNKNKLSDENINNIINLLKGRKEVENKSYLAMYEEVKENDYALTPGRYVGTPEEEDDGIPFEEKMKKLTSELSKQLKEEEALNVELKKVLGAIGYEI